MKVQCAYSELIKIENIKPHPRNPNTHPQKQIELLAKIIAETGWRSPVVVSNRSGFVVKGHGRLAAALYAGFEFVPVDLQDYDSEEQELSDLVADNRIAELSEMNTDLLDGILLDLHGDEFDMELAGFSDWLPVMEDAEGLTDPDDVPEAAPPVCERGQVWRLGDHRLMCGDSTSLSNVQTLMGGGCYRYASY